MEIFGLWPKFFFWQKRFAHFSKQNSVRPDEELKETFFNFNKSFFLNVTGNLSSVFLFNWQNLFWRFLATVSFVSGGTVWDYELFYWKYKSCWYTFGHWATTFLDMSRFLPAGFLRVYSSCADEPFHRKDFLSKKKQNISSPPEVEWKRFLKFGRSISRMLSLVGSTCPDETLWTFFEQKTLIPFDPYQSFVGFLAFFFRNLFQKRIQQVEQKSWRRVFLCPSKSFFYDFREIEQKFLGY